MVGICVAELHKRLCRHRHRRFTILMLAQAEALGILGVNLIHGALTKGGDHYAIVSSLMDDLSRARIEVVNYRLLLRLH